MSRAGLSYLISFVREYAAVGTADYQVGGTNYWSDDQIQETLMRWHSRFYQIPLLTFPETEGGSTVYKTYSPKYGRYFEGTASGSPYWVVTDSQGSTIPTSAYTVDSVTATITFSANQAGSARYLTAYAYKPESAVSDIWQSKAAHLSAYDFTSGNQTFNRSQMFDQAIQMANHWRSLTGLNYNEIQRVDTGKG